MSDNLWPWPLVVFSVALGAMLAGVALAVDNINTHNRHRESCARAGYPEIFSAGGTYYCVKLEHGSQLVVRSPLEKP